MALLQISEPGQAPDPHQRRIAVGIDLGTTHSLVAAVRNGVAECLPDSQGRTLLPSVVRYLEGAAARSDSMRTQRRPKTPRTRSPRPSASWAAASPTLLAATSCPTGSSSSRAWCRWTRGPRQVAGGGQRRNPGHAAITDCH